MKNMKLYIGIILCVMTMFACKKEGFQLYESGDYIQFVKYANDSTTVSFLASPDADSKLFPVAVELVGNLADRDRTFQIAVIDSLTTATNSNFDIPDRFTFRANRTVDTAWITIRKTPEIAVAPVKLVFKLLPSDDFMVGQVEYSVGLVTISNVISQPDWWNSTVTGRFLGDYSDKKYRLFIEVTGQSDIDSSDLTVIRSYTILFKNYLLKEKDAGRTVYEENGTEMTVSLIGG